MRRLSLILLVIILIAGCSKKDRLKEFTESHHSENAYFFYPSTLRMVNLENNPDFDEMIGELEKGSLYVFNGSAELKGDIKMLEDQLISDGYEEILVIKNKEVNAKVLLLDKETPTILSIVESNDKINLLEINGMINPVKIPKLLESFDDENFLNVFNLHQNDEKNRHIEHTEDQQPE